MVLGQLHVTVVEARKLKNKDGLFGKNDPYVNVEVGSKKEKTKVLNNAGKAATWNETFSFPVPNEKAYLHIEVMDHDNVTMNDLIGMVNVPLHSVRQFGLMECWFPLTKNHDFAGELNLFLRFEGKNMAAHNPPPPQAAPSKPSNPPQQQGTYPPPQGNYPPQQGAYPPPQQQGPYPPQQGAYPPQQGAYPPQQGNYPPQQGAYPPPQQQGPYPPQQGAYPPQQGGGYPPQYGGGYPPQQGGGYPPAQGQYRPH